MIDRILLQVIDKSLWTILNIEFIENHIVELIVAVFVLVFFEKLQILGIKATSLVFRVSLVRINAILSLGLFSFLNFDQKFLSVLLKVERLFHPWVVLDLIKSWSLFWVIAKHFEDEILKF